MRYVSIDIETTGLNPENCQILQIGAIIEDTKNPLPYEEIPKFKCFVEHPEYSGQPTAISMNSWIFDILSGLDGSFRENRTDYRKQHNIIPVGLVARAVRLWLIDNGIMPEDTSSPVKITVAGKNFASFDKRFLEQLPGWGPLIQVRQRIIDPSVLLIDWEKDEVPPSLNSCIKRLEIDGEVSHDALEDAFDVIRVLRGSTKNYTIKLF
jgi:oligoribonuclease